MRTWTIAAVALLALGLGACTRHGSDRNAERARQTEVERDTAAHKAGRAAYDIAQEAEKAAKKAGQKLKETSHDMHEGWKDAKRDAKESGKK
ncbi:MAG: hypothetical protein ACR2NN_14170 [Bryobacteraceae bacterium]